MISRRHALATALVAGLIALAAGCSSAKPATSASGGVDKITVGVVPVIDVAPLYLGLSKGFFTQQKLQVSTKVIQSGATIVASVVSSALQVGFSNNTSLLIAASKGLPLRVVAAGNQAASGDYAAVFSRTDSGIKTPQDLVGKKIAVNSLNNVGPLTINAALEASGVDYKKVSYVEVAFPDMAAALSQKRVDTVWAVEPFVSAIKSGGGAQIVMRPYPLISPHFPVASYFVSTQYQKAHASVVDRFRQAMNQSLQYAQAHPDEVRAILPSYITLNQQVAGQVVLPEWSTDVGADLLGHTADLAQKYGYLSTKPDIGQLVGSG
jgi:NitT/TauT family transport system substrate-binding protein